MSFGNREASFPDERKSQSRSLRARWRRPWRFSHRLQTRETSLLFWKSGSFWRILRRRESGKESVRSTALEESESKSKSKLKSEFRGLEVDLGDWAWITAETTSLNDVVGWLSHDPVQLARLLRRGVLGLVGIFSRNDIVFFETSNRILCS